MSARPTLTEHQRAAYETVVANPDAPFGVRRPPLFSPAIEVQDEASQGGLHQWAAMFLPRQYGDWVQEARAHVETCYLGDWSSLSKLVLRGPEAHAFLSWVGMADLSTFEVGQIKHHVQLDANGWVASEGIVARTGHEEFLFTAGGSEWLRWQFGQGSWDAEVVDVTPDRFIFGVQGPRSLDVLAKLTDDDLRDIGFNRTRTARIAGVEMPILRTGISGELGYELHGPAEQANAIWAAIRDEGAELGLRQLGNRAQSVQHIEAGIATNGLDYIPSSAVTPGALKLFRQRGIAGSFVPSGGFSDYFRTPGELAWVRRSGIPQHDFLGRDALLAQAAGGGPARTLVGLVWNRDDVLGVFASLFSDGAICEQMEIPRRSGPEFDQVLVGGVPVGVSSGRTVSPNVRATISLCVIDREHAAPGTEATVIWGRPGSAQREIRAAVVALPFKPDRRRTVTRQAGTPPDPAQA